MNIILKKIICVLISLYSSIVFANEKTLGEMQEGFDYLLPESIINRNYKIEFRIKSFTKKLLKVEEICSNVDLVKSNKYKDNIRITIDPVIVKAWNNNQEISCLHKESKYSALGLILRSFASAIDKDDKISKDYKFLNLSGWFRKGLIFKRKTNLNVLDSRSFDAREFDNPKNTMSINFELFLMDPEFKCRRSNLYQYFSDKYDVLPFRNSSCESNNLIVLKSQLIKDPKELIQSIDPKRVYELHYLYAGKGKRIMSRWGHAMFRVVMCKEGQKKGPECARDISNNFVLGFRATIEEMKMEMWKGVTGKYPSHMSIQPLMEVVNEYTVGEGREVISYPMKMNEIEINRFITKALETYWSYEGSYFFFTNNCATEAMNLIRSSFLENSKLQKKSIHTPLGILKYLDNNNIIDTDVLNNEESAIYNGYLFKPKSQQISLSLNQFGISDKSENGLKSFMLLGASKRSLRYQSAIDKADTVDKKRKIYSDAIRIEDRIIQLLDMDFSKNLVLLVQSRKNLEDNELLLKLEKIIMKSNSATTIMQSSYDTYGNPLSDELDVIKNASAESATSFIEENTEELLKILNQYFPELINELGASKLNKSNLVYGLTQLLHSR